MTIPNNMTNQLKTQEKIQALTDKIDSLLRVQRKIKYNNFRGVPFISFPPEIRVGNILLALNKVGDDKYYAIGIDGRLFYFTEGDYYNDTEDVTVLELALPLHEQSEQTIAELYKLFFE